VLVARIASSAGRATTRVGLPPRLRMTVLPSDPQAPTLVQPLVQGRRDAQET